jgi:hypothetical protein
LLFSAGRRSGRRGVARRDRPPDSERYRATIPLAAAAAGWHLLADVLASATPIVGVDAAAMTRAVEGFTGLEHALEPVAEVGGVRFVNDSKATNIESARRAVESFGDGVVVVLGGRFKGGDFRDLMAPLVERHATVVSIGEARPLIRETLGSAVAIHEADDMSSACGRFRRRRSDSRPAPACELICSATMRARPRVQAGGAATRGMDDDPRTVARSEELGANNEQSSAGGCGEEPPAGNAGCPGLRGWCLCPRPADDC